jgi:hypothetical protein
MPTKCHAALGVIVVAVPLAMLAFGIAPTPKNSRSAMVSGGVFATLVPVIAWIVTKGINRDRDRDRDKDKGAEVIGGGLASVEAEIG